MADPRPHGEDLDEERRNPGADLPANGGAGASPAQHRKEDEDTRFYREEKVQAGTQREPTHPDEDDGAPA